MAVRLLLLLALLAVRMELPGCGPFIPVSLFTLQHQPEKPAAEFARGQLGVLLPSYTRDSLIVAYRYLEGVGLSDAERRALYPPPPEPLREFPRNPWLEARQQVPGVAEVKNLDPVRIVQSPNMFEMYTNCNDDAFVTAAATLARVSKQWGPGSARVREWVAVQDQVFANCAKGPSIPEANGDSERAYQVAAARFYAGQHEAALHDFEAIAQDGASAWHGIAPYLAARCLIRAHDYEAAAQRLQQVIDDPARARWHDSARGLLAYVQAKAHPEERLHELASAVLRRDSATLARDATDYHFLLDHHEGVEPRDDITAWILNFQGANAAGAVEKWRSTHSSAWLIAAISKVNSGNPAVPDLVAAARAVKPGSPAYATVAFHAARLLPPEESRRVAGEALRTRMPVSARNLFRALRMRNAIDFDDFLQYAARTAVGEDGIGEFALEPKGEYLDSDSAFVLSRLTPLRLLRRAAESKALPQQVRQNLRDVIYVRGVLLGPQPPKADDVYRILRTPSLKPYLDTGYGRSTKAPEKIDSFQDNWWCGAGSQETGSWQFKARTELSPVLARLGNPDAAWVPPAEQAEAKTEWEQLRKLPGGPAWLGEQTLAWARRQPADPRLPEALHLAVRATRYGCPGADNSKYSRAAFDLLHRRFPASEWTKKTPYWY